MTAIPRGESRFFCPRARYSGRGLGEGAVLFRSQVFSRLAQRRGRADFEKTIGDLESDHLPVGYEPGVQVGQVVLPGRRNPLGCSAAQQRYAEIDVAHSPVAATLVVANQLAVFENHVTAIPLIVVSQNGHEG